MRRESLVVLVVLGVFVATPLLAADKPSGPPKPPAELKQLSFFNGTWHCTGKTFASQMGAEHATEAIASGHMGLGGMWMEMRYDEKKTAANETPIHAAVFLGYDTDKKKFTMGCVDSTGTYCSQLSDGWTGDKIAFEGHALNGDGKMGLRDTFTKVGADGLGHLGEMQGSDGTWAKLDEEKCTKGAAKK